MDDRTYRNVLASIAEARRATADMARRLGVPPLTDEPNQAEIDAMTAAGLRYQSVDDIEKFLKGGK